MRKHPAIPRIEWDALPAQPNEMLAQQQAYNRLTHGRPDYHPTSDEIERTIAGTEADLYEERRILSVEATTEIMNILRRHAEELGETL